MSDNQNNDVVSRPLSAEKLRKILYTTGLLSLVTCIEFALTLTLPKSFGLVIVLVTLTFVKAFYIIAEFMHLGYENLAFKLFILTPLSLLSWFVVSLLYESNGILERLIYR